MGNIVQNLDAGTGACDPDATRTCKSLTGGKVPDLKSADGDEAAVSLDSDEALSARHGHGQIRPIDDCTLYGRPNHYGIALEGNRLPFRSGMWETYKLVVDSPHDIHCGARRGCIGRVLDG